jgi:hypothetical protein
VVRSRLEQSCRLTPILCRPLDPSSLLIVQETPTELDQTSRTSVKMAQRHALSDDQVRDQTKHVDRLNVLLLKY